MSTQRIVLVKARYPGRWVTGILAALVVFFIVRAFLLSPNIDWKVVGSYLGAESVLSGLQLTIFLAVISMVVGIVLGILLAMMRLSKNPVLQVISSGYVWLVRGTPSLIQIIIWYNLALVFPTIGLDLPGIGTVFSVDTNSLITVLTAAIIALGLNQAAWMAEIIRGGILSVGEGQSLAARALGMTERRAMYQIVLPQATRSILPATGNNAISMLKETSLVSFIGTQELLTSVQHIYSVNFFTIELLLVACFWYLVMTSIAMFLQSLLERRLEVSLSHSRDTWLTQKLRGLILRPKTGEGTE